MMYPKPTKRKKKVRSMKDLFEEIWNERPHKCNNCGLQIKEAKAHNFSHLKSKGSRPDLKYDKDNIEIACSTLDRKDKEEGCHELWGRKRQEYYKRSKS